ncbi:MAG TPA: DsrE family protein [Nocardioidaceae bacterium]|nr:DsrE family protein [Nocardioidaceae bacterium]
MARSLLIKVTTGAEDAERCNQAFTVAAAAAASGVEVGLWLTGESVWFAVQGKAPVLNLPHAAPASELLAAVRAAGTVTVCTQCARRREVTEADVLPGVRIAGAPTFVEEALAEDVQALVY